MGLNLDCRQLIGCNQYLAGLYVYVESADLSHRACVRIGQYDGHPPHDTLTHNKRRFTAVQQIAQLAGDQAGHPLTGRSGRNVDLGRHVNIDAA
jgi:hypothetical protein